MGRHAASDVVFDFDGALAVAKRLWAFAESIGSVMATREQLANEALATWRGNHAVSFAQRLGTERTDIDTAATWLQAGALEWAAAWKDAMDEQNRILFARECQRRKDEAEWHESGVFGAVFGGPDMPDEPSAVAVPTAPNFEPTGGFVSY
jgi:hypothetical protein